MGEKLEYVLEKKKRKTIGITIKENGDILVKAPLKCPNYKVFDFINSKQNWIYKNHIKLKDKYNKISFKDGGNLKILGKDYIINTYNTDDNFKMELKDKKVYVYIPTNITEDDKEKIIKNTYYKMLYKIAQDVIPNEINKISNLVGLKPKELKIRNFKRAWGNCSSKKIISINKDLCKFSIDAIDYVCLHEICHLKYMNHSKEFWAMVKKYMPNYKEIEKELK